MTSHLPGPWKISRPLKTVKVETELLVKGHGVSIAAVVMGSGRADMNANLIAAAPDLLAACEFVSKFAAMRVEKGEPLPSQVTLAVDRALAIARGEPVSA